MNGRGKGRALSMKRIIKKEDYQERGLSRKRVIYE
jgi:hypothetical protein